MGTKKVLIDAALNAAIWDKGIKNVPHRIRVRLQRESAFLGGGGRGEQARGRLGRDSDGTAADKTYALQAAVTMMRMPRTTRSFTPSRPTSPPRTSRSVLSSPPPPVLLLTPRTHAGTPDHRCRHRGGLNHLLVLPPLPSTSPSSLPLLHLFRLSQPGSTSRMPYGTIMGWGRKGICGKGWNG